MRRGPLGVMAALAAWLILIGASAPNNNAQAAPPKITTGIERSLADIANAQAQAVEQGKPSEYQAPCQRDEYNNKSDLCAQWYAASAARDAANLAWWAVFWTVVSTVISICGLVALIVTIWHSKAGLHRADEANKLARTEFEAARKDADAAAAANAEALLFARKSAEAAQAMVESDRPWVCGDGVEMHVGIGAPTRGMEPRPTIALLQLFKNFGQVPALVKSVSLGVSHFPFADTLPATAPHMKKHEAPLVLGRDQPLTLEPHHIFGPPLDIFRNKESKIALYSRVEYFDI